MIPPRLPPIFILTDVTSDSCTGFYCEGIYLESSNNTVLTNVTANSNAYCGVYIYLSYGNSLTNVTANSNDEMGILIYLSDNNTLTNITANDNTFYGIWIDEGSDLELFGDGKQSRDFTYIDDIADGTIKALKKLRVR